MTNKRNDVSINPNHTESSNLTSNVTSTATTYWANSQHDLIVVSIWSIILVYAFFSNLIVILGILRNNSMRHSTSYWFIISLAVCDLVMVVISAVHLIPATYWHDDFMEVDSWRNIWALFFYDLFWYTGVLELGLMAFNRFASIIYPMEYKRWFSREHTFLIIGILYLLGFLVSIPTLHPCCHTLYSHYNYVTLYDPPDTWYYVVDLLVNTFSVVIMVFSYAAIVWKVHSNQRALAKYKSNTSQCSKRADAKSAKDDDGPSTSTVANGLRETDSLRTASTVTGPVRPHMSRREFRLFVQFFVVSLIFLLTWSTWQWLPHINFGSMHSTKWIYFLLTTFFFINNCVNPTVYLLFNTTLRREVKSMFRKIFVRCGVLAPDLMVNNERPGRKRTWRNKGDADNVSALAGCRTPMSQRALSGSVSRGLNQVNASGVNSSSSAEQPCKTSCTPTKKQSTPSRIAQWKNSSAGRIFMFRRRPKQSSVAATTILTKIEFDDSCVHDAVDVLTVKVGNGSDALTQQFLTPDYVARTATVTVEVPQRESVVSQKITETKMEQNDTPLAVTATTGPPVDVITEILSEETITHDENEPWPGTLLTNAIEEQTQRGPNVPRTNFDAVLDCDEMYIDEDDVICLSSTL